MNKLEHLKMIQTIISRMAGNSFLIKGWCVTLVAAILALAAKEPNKLFIAVALFPVVMFWILDGYFLHQERLFRKLYDRVLESEEDSIDYSMNTSAFQENVTWRKTIFSLTLNLFYIFILFSIIVIFCIALFLPSMVAPVGK
jgi:hypothetical protein